MKIKLVYFSEEKLNRIFDKTSGYCVFCGIQLAWDNYGEFCARGGWEVEHGNPASRGGVNDLRNLNPACTLCNREKSDWTSNEFKNWVMREYNSWEHFHRAMREKYCR